MGSERGGSAPEGCLGDGALAPPHDIQVQRVQHFGVLVVREVHMHLAPLLIHVHVMESA